MMPWAPTRHCLNICSEVHRHAILACLLCLPQYYSGALYHLFIEGCKGLLRTWPYTFWALEWQRARTMRTKSACTLTVTDLSSRA